MTETAGNHGRSSRTFRSPGAGCILPGFPRNACRLRRKLMYWPQRLRRHDRDTKRHHLRHGRHRQSNRQRDGQPQLCSGLGVQPVRRRWKLHDHVRRHASLHPHRKLRWREPAFAGICRWHIQYNTRNRVDACLPCVTTRHKREWLDSGLPDQFAVPADTGKRGRCAGRAIRSRHESAAALCGHADGTGISNDILYGRPGRRRQRSWHASGSGSD